MRHKTLSAAAVLFFSPLMAHGAVMQILFPAYEDPSDTAYWNTLISSVSPQTPITVIMNPLNGPVSTVDPFYTSAIPNIQAAGGQMIGYVDSDDDDGNPRSLSAIEADVATYKGEYPNLNGIFVDDMSYNSSGLSMFKSLYLYIKQENAQWQVFGNPGTTTLEGYLSPTPAAADVLVSYESTQPKYTTTPPSTWQLKYPGSNFSNIVYSLSSTTTMQSDVTLAEQNRAGYVYFTNDVANDADMNPYDSIPSYWQQELAAVAAVNAAPVKSSYLLTGAGDFNTLGNWSYGIPTGIGAEADFLTSITAATTVSSSSAITLGKIVFDSSNSYTLGGTGSLAMQTSSGSAVIDAQLGTQKITLPMTIASNTTVQAESGATLQIAGAVTVDSGVSLTQAGAGSVQFQSSLSILNGGSITLAPTSSATSLSLAGVSKATLLAETTTPRTALQLGSLSIASGSTLDITSSDVIVHNGNLTTIAAAIKTGFNTGGSPWAGTGITSSSAATSHNTAVGTILNLAHGTAIYTTFDQDSVTTTDVLVKYTYYGDANLDGAVDGSDYTLIDNGFNTHLTGWYNGDFNYDGKVDGSDYTLIDNAFHTQGATLGSNPAAQFASVPEPATGGILLFTAAALSFKTRNRRGHLR